MNTSLETFEQNLSSLINRFCKENDSDTPDYILAKYMNECLESYTRAVRARDAWFNVDMWSDDKLLHDK